MGESGDSALSYYRRYLPMQALSGAGWTVAEAPVLAERHPDHRLVGVNPGGGLMKPTRVVVIRAPKDPMGKELGSAAMFRAGREQGQRVFVDLDDDVWHLPDYNPAAPQWTPEALAIFAADLDACDGVLCSTGPLADEVRKHTGTPVHVAPNGIDVRRFPVRRRSRPVRVGWAGLLQWRWEDFAMVADQLRDGLDGPRCEFWHLGLDTTFDRSIRELLPEGWPVRVVEKQWVPFEAFGALLAVVDVAVVPMADTPLNRARSATTGLAFAAVGVPFVASPLPAYRELAAQVPGVYLLSDDAWAGGVRTLVDAARDDRLPTADQMRIAVHAAYGPVATARAWHKALTAGRLLVAR